RDGRRRPQEIVDQTVDRSFHFRPGSVRQAETRKITAVAKGDLLQTVPLDVEGRALKGEFLRSADIVNTMIKQLSVLTSEVKR
ncbi:hypothetical protein, partial [Rhizobium johnstonii]|uniref:hypothetical protein n=1 Tax=Rhizobium johnstonii TaxID=3019933 RepID=UPI003F9CF5D2